LEAEIGAQRLLFDADTLGSASDTAAFGRSEHCRLQYERGSDVDDDLRDCLVYRDRDLGSTAEGELFQVGADGKVVVRRSAVL
jgi:hypothetical protein